MAKNAFFPTNPSHNKAACILASMSPDMVRGIVALCNERGGSLVQDLFASEAANSMGQSRFLAIFSSDYIDDADFEDVWVGFSAICLAQIRKPRMGRDEYEKVLQDAYSLPGNMANTLADKIETRDVLGGADDKRAWYEQFAEGIVENVKRAINWGAEVLHLPWEIDETQEYDIDFLYELKLLGGFIGDLNSRVRLMSSQAAIFANTGLLEMDTEGDVDEDDETLEATVGDVFRVLSMRRLPRTIFGGQANIARAGHAASRAQMRSVISAGGYHNSVTPTGEKVVTQAPTHSPKIKKVIDKILHGKPGPAIIAGAALGLTPVGVMSLVKAIRSRRTPYMGDAYSDIASGHGETIANAWRMGDVDGVLEEVLRVADLDDVTSGDPAMDAAIDQNVLQDIISEGGDVDSEIGGIFTRYRTNAAKMAAARRSRRGYKKQARQVTRNRQTQQRMIQRAKKKSTYIPNVQRMDFLDDTQDYEENMPMDDEAYQDQYAGPEYFEDSDQADLATLPWPTM